ncbi:MAG TPA: hypothetical protein VKQ72_03355 [Aggregatilineales bacterium]|nr:hypothetical protein [Aggregatilineales bacterium]
MTRLFHFISRFKKLHWQQIALLVPIAMGYSSCAICGVASYQGKDVCAYFNLLSVDGLPDGPVKLTFNAPPYGIVGYKMWVAGDSGLLGQTGWEPPTGDGKNVGTVTMSVTLDKAGVAKTMADGGDFYGSGLGPVDTGPNGECEFDWSKKIGAPKEHKAPVNPNPTSAVSPVCAVGIQGNVSSCPGQQYYLGANSCCTLCPTNHLRNNSNQCVCIQGYTDNGNPGGQCAPVPAAPACNAQLIAKCAVLRGTNGCTEVCSKGQCVPSNNNCIK